MATIYLSSTYEDLVDHRRVTFDALRKSGYEVIAMEEYVASDRRPLETCLKDISRDGVIYVGIFAFRYGYIPPKQQIRECAYTEQHEEWQGLSITEVEFRYAQWIGRPCLVFVAKKGTDWNTQYIDALTETGNDHPGNDVEKLRDYLLTEKTTGEFSSPHQLASLVQAAVARHIQERENRDTAKASPQPEITWDINKKKSPYRGLKHFTRRYAPVFFGREKEVLEILDRLRIQRCPFILVSGDSGVGKSSVVDAGVLPRLETGGLADGKSCVSMRMVPSQGDHPFDALMRALHTPAEQAGFDPYATGKDLLNKPADLPARLKEIMAKGIGPSSLVLFLDQMEELFTSSIREHAPGFLTALFEAAHEGALWVVATIRSDFLHYCHDHPDLLKVLGGAGYNPIGPVDTLAMADMIKKPAQCAGLEIDDRLVARIIKDTGVEPGNLPLLSFVLEQLFDNRVNRTLTEQVYDGFGGVTGAIANHVEGVEKRLHDDIGDAVDSLIPRLFQSLLVVDREGLPTRQRTRLADVPQEITPLVNELIKARLLSTEGEGRDSTVSITHEKLFDAWPALGHWITENKDDLWLQRQVRLAAAEWEKEQVDKGKHLWTDERVMDVVKMMDRLGLGEANFSERERLFLGPVDRKTMLADVDDPTLSHEQRATIGRRLSLLGDPRPGVGLRPDGLPDMVWCEVPGGEITLEIERRGRLSRLIGGSKQETLYVKPFHIAKYPVTWSQYKAFIKAQDGYNNPAWWENLIGPFEKPKRQFNAYANHPAENMVWFEAVVFCRWLSHRLGYEINLPTEFQWQQAATGGDPANVYPWGEKWNETSANTDDSNLHRTTAVGVYPLGASPVGALDMAGNVWEWCLNEYDRPQRVGISGENSRCLRGGSWSDNPDSARAALRNHFRPSGRYSLVGFRVCCASPIFLPSAMANERPQYLGCGCFRTIS